MDKKKIYGLVLAAGIFVGGNLFLLLKENSKAGRETFVSEWTAVGKGDIVKTFPTEGVVMPEQEFSIYYNPNEGPISEMFVEEGDWVTPDTPLFSYGTDRFMEEEQRIEARIERIGREIASVETKIKDLDSISAAGEVNNPSIEETDDGIQVSVDVQMEAAAIIDSETAKAVVEAEAELEQKEAELEEAEAELDRLLDKKEQASVVSEVEGEIIAVNDRGDNPLIRIASPSISVSGLLDEKQRQEAEEQMEVRLYSSLHNEKYTGSILKIHGYPKKAPSLSEEAEYPFVVALDSQGVEEAAAETEEKKEPPSDGGNGNMENQGEDAAGDDGGDQDSADGMNGELVEQDVEWLPGNKVDMNVIVDRADDVLVVEQKRTLRADKKRFVYVLTDSGTVERRNIKVGLAFKGRQEVREGLEPKNLIVTDPTTIDVSSIPFVTPLKATTIQKKQIKKLSKKQTAKYLLMGFIEG
ncbi:MAG: hypothetical protein ACI4XL_10570 [Bacillus sp. (in: firmicutes)]